MPRRKKKSTLERKPSLVFTESPVNIQNNVLTPVLCARHPPTASSVPIENLSNLSWVSPQFRNVSSSGGHRRHRNTRQRRHSVASHRNLLNSHGLNKENHSHSNQMTKLKKFNSLKFVGDRTCASIIEDVEITIETDTPNEEDGDDNRITLMSSLNSGSEHGHHGPAGSCDNRINNVSVGEDSVLSENLGGTHPMKLRAPVKRLFASQLGTFQGSSFDDSPNKSISNERVVHDDLLAQIQSQAVLESEEESPVLLRRSARLQQLQSLLNMSDSPYRNSRDLKVVLAPDTPENEYGWSKRKRQLIKYIKKTS